MRSSPVNSSVPSEALNLDCSDVSQPRVSTLPHRQSRTVRRENSDFSVLHDVKTASMDKGFTSRAELNPFVKRRLLNREWVRRVW